MPWNLEIRTIDVGQGESSFIHVYDDDGDESRTMLIDGGLQAQGLPINKELNDVIGDGTPVDHILVSHYDIDHSGGIMALLGADNYSSICQTIAIATNDSASLYTERNKRVAAGTAAACAVFLGAYNLPGGGQYLYMARLAAQSAATLTDKNTTLAQAAQIGIDEAENIVDGVNDMLIPYSSKKKRRDVSKTAGYAAAAALATTKPEYEKLADIEEAIFTDFNTFVKPNFRFNTNGRFNTTNVIDTGTTEGVPEGYERIVRGEVLMSGNKWIKAPDVNRQRSTPALGSEILWNSGPQAKTAPVGSPMIFTMARNKKVWSWTGTLSPAIDNNNDCFAVMLRFNKFFFYTGGDLIAEGEDVIADKIRSVQLPNPNGGSFPIATRIAAFKCGHHGANTCTSQKFLDKAIPAAALISCGNNSYGHPAPGVVERLHKLNSMRYFYLTGCPTETDYIPATAHPPQNQLVFGNKSRVAGGIAIPPGDITLTISSEESEADGFDRVFTMTYYDYDLPVAAYRMETIIF